MTDARYVATPEALAQVVTAFRRESPVAVDTEAASFHRFVDRVYLIQLSTRRATAIVDPLAVTDLSPIGELLADRGVEKIFHDADYDLRTLDRDACPRRPATVRRRSRRCWSILGTTPISASWCSCASSTAR